MSDKPQLNVVLCWHMHQPMYCNRLSGEYKLPWTYLHAIKDYVDMVAHLEAVPTARAVVNFAPILLEQIDDYVQQLDAFLRVGTVVRDPLLSALGSAVLPVDVSQRVRLIKDCLRANEDRLVKRFKHFHRLAEMAKWFTKHQEANLYINDQFIVDLVMWYHIAWLGETVRREDSRVKELIKKDGGYTFRDRRILIEVIYELMSGVINRYKVLAHRGQIELSMTPYAHPIVPLLLDINSAKQAMPDVKLPLMVQYPGGAQRTQWHIAKGIETFKRYFDLRPVGCWPSEGSVSDATIETMQQAGFKWVASGETVIRNSINYAKQKNELQTDPGIYRGYKLKDGQIACFFRDDGLSDLVGFTYSTWHADDAVANLVHHLEKIYDNINQNLTPNTNEYIVSIVLDGENAWEYYPENGYYFLSALYKKLADNPKLNLTTFKDCLAQQIPLQSIPHVVAGSWVYGTFSTWIGDQDKNRAWDMLGDAKRSFDITIGAGTLSAEQVDAAENQLAICEGSDWFWWFGDYNPADAVSDFDHLFRMQLVNLYQILGVEPPEYLSHVFSHGSGMPQLGGVMRRGTEQQTG